MISNEIANGFICDTCYHLFETSTSEMYKVYSKLPFDVNALLIELADIIDRTDDEYWKDRLHGVMNWASWVLAKFYFCHKLKDDIKTANVQNYISCDDLIDIVLKIYSESN